jgi:GGDEF domain-containing protein
MVILSELLFVGQLLRQGVRISIYMILGFWAVAYLVVWVSYWRVDKPLPLQVLFLQFILIELAAGLSFNVGRNIGQLDKTLDGLSATTYPNRAIELEDAEERINDELARCRRYHHSLPVLVLQLESINLDEARRQQEPLQRDMLVRLTNAKFGQIISELSRHMDLILRDRKGQFIVLCPETSFDNISILAERIRSEVFARLGLVLVWGSAAFPDDALTFEDLITTAQQRAKSVALPEQLMKIESVESV